MIDWLIDWLVFNTNFSSISDISWCANSTWYLYQYKYYTKQIQYSLSYKTIPSVMKKNCLIRWMASLEGDNLHVFYYLSASEIFFDKKGRFDRSGLIRWMASLEGDNLHVFYYLMISASEIWPNKRGGLWWEWFYKRETTAVLFKLFWILLLSNVKKNPHQFTTLKHFCSDVKNHLWS